MKIQLLAKLAFVAVVVFLVGCASDPKNPSDLKPVSIELSTLMEQGAAAEKSETKEAAIRKYEEAARSYPAAKQPWARIAQIQFDSGNYGQAIVAAQQVVARDERDKVAHSILSVSGLRVSTKALADLSRQNELTGSVRNEAQGLTRMLRDSLGEQVLVPAQPAPPRPTPPPRPPAATPSASPVATTPAKPAGAPPAPSGGGSNNPFGALK
jgi:hypothetical protein